ncbi:MAG: hypothetical protein AAGU75_09625 [Bacillota bacterium]
MLKATTLLIKDAKGNKLSEYKRGNGTGSAKENITYQYDALDRIVYSHENFGNSTRGYQYDSLGNLTYETTDGNKFTDYKYNILNQMTYRTSDLNGSEYYTYEYDSRGNLLKENLTKAGKVLVEGSYVYNEMNKLSMGTNNIGETSTYVYNGLQPPTRFARCCPFCLAKQAWGKKATTLAIWYRMYGKSRKMPMDIRKSKRLR